jgi:hypothetical protein
MARMRGVRAPQRRTAPTAHPPIRGCAAGCAVGGASPEPPAHRWSPSSGGGVVRPQRQAALPPWWWHHPARAPSPMSRYPTRTPLAAPGHVHTRTRLRTGPSGPLTGRTGVIRAGASYDAGRYACHWRTPRPLDGRDTAGHTPRGASRLHRPRPTGPPWGVERACRKVRFARLIHAPGARSLADLRSAPPTAASDAGRIATQGDAADVPPPRRRRARVGDLPSLAGL